MCSTELRRSCDSDGAVSGAGTVLSEVDLLGEVGFFGFWLVGTCSHVADTNYLKSRRS